MPTRGYNGSAYGCIPLVRFIFQKIHFFNADNLHFA